MKENIYANSSYWLDQVCNEIEELHPKGELLVSSGISPSGPYHLGHSREVLTADAVFRAMKERGRKIRHIHFVDDFDALRKRYPYLDESYEQEAGKPLYKINAPDGKSVSYADQYFADYQQAIAKLGIELEIIRSHKEYQKGTFAETITESIKKRDQVVDILARVSGREVESDWLPIQILDESSDSLRTAKFISFDEKNSTVHYLGSDGKEYDADIKKGQVKLDWRLDWPARWKIWGNQVEGFGREHATKGGSYDTGKVIAKEIFDCEAPFPIPYEFINLKGDTKKMSSSVGNLVTINDVLNIIPAEIIRYFTFKSKPERQLFFDPGLGLYNLIDEYAKTEAETLIGNNPEYKRSWQIASLSGSEHVISTVPFSHLVTSYQASRGDEKQVLGILSRTGHQKAVKNQKQAILRELTYVANWLSNFAPDNVKFKVLDKKPKLTLSKQELEFISSLESSLTKVEFEAEALHSAIYHSTVAVKIDAKVAFELIYKIFIGQSAGPRAGYFLASLGEEFVSKRLKEMTSK